MPLGIVSDKDFFNEIEEDSDIKPRTSNIDIENATPSTAIVGEVLDFPTVGRHSDIPDIPISLKKILAETHAIEGLSRAQELANSFGGLSQPTLSTLGSGNTSRGTHKSRAGNSLVEHLNNRKTKISNRALNKINLALAHMTEDKFEDLEMRELATIAKDMSVVAKQMEPTKIDEGHKDPVQFHFYSPQVRTENHYDVVVAKDNY